MPNAEPYTYKPDAAKPSRRLRDDGTDSTERNYAIAMHLTPLAAGITGILIFVPLILWLIKKDESVFCDDHGREVINFYISQLIVIIILACSVVGWPLLIVWPFVVLVNLIRGAVAAGNGEYFRYPMTFRFIN